MPQMQLTPEEARHIMKRRRSEAKDGVFRQGLNAAAEYVLCYAGTMDTEAERNAMAAAIMRIKRPRKTTKES